MELQRAESIVVDRMRYFHHEHIHAEQKRIRVRTAHGKRGAGSHHCHSHSNEEEHMIANLSVDLQYGSIYDSHKEHINDVNLILGDGARVDKSRMGAGDDNYSMMSAHSGNNTNQP